MPAGYMFRPQPNDVASAVLSKSTWAVLGLTLDIELFTQAHYRSSIATDPNLSELWKDVFLFHWKEESQHAIIDEMEWLAEDKRLEEAVGELEKLRKLDPKDALTLLQLGMLYASQKKSTKAIETYTTLLAQEPKAWQALRGRGDA
jgi:tetratricopeptide (TPR) repeat protein